MGSIAVGFLECGESRCKNGFHDIYESNELNHFFMDQASIGSVPYTKCFSHFYLKSILPLINDNSIYFKKIIKVKNVSPFATLQNSMLYNPINGEKTSKNLLSGKLYPNCNKATLHHIYSILKDFVQLNIYLGPV